MGRAQKIQASSGRRGATGGSCDSIAQVPGAREDCRGPPHHVESHSNTPIAAPSICSLSRGFATAVVPTHLTRFDNSFLNYLSFKLYMKFFFDHGEHPYSPKTQVFLADCAFGRLVSQSWLPILSTIASKFYLPLFLPTFEIENLGQFKCM